MSASVEDGAALTRRAGEARSFRSPSPHLLAAQE
jgi:hypothetical protein